VNKEQIHATDSLTATAWREQYLKVSAYSNARARLLVTFQHFVNILKSLPSYSNCDNNSMRPI
jgi:hypothetical protein